MQSRYKEIISKNPEKTFIVHWTNWPITWFLKNIYYINKKFTFKDMQYHDLFKNFNCFEGSFMFSISLAIYCGFKKIYLVGFDYTHSPARINHFYEKGKGLINNQKFNGYEKEFIRATREYVDIITVTLDGKSNHLDYITYKDLTGEDPAYRENTELVNHKYLKVLSSWPGYTI
jgi:hypothetical protein